MSVQETPASLLPKACENCRTRKIRCNRVIPCSNCTTSGISCRPAPLIRESRPRIFVSNNYEKQIESIHDRLLGIERSLRGLSVSSGDPYPPSAPDSALQNDEEAHDVVHFEGDSSFQHQSQQASEHAEVLAGKDSSDLRDAIASLKSLINTQGAPIQPDQKFQFSDARVKLPDPELLPVNFTVHVIKKIKENLPITCLAYFFRDVSEWEQICKRVYFPTEQVSLGEKTAMFGFMYFLIQEFTTMNDPIINQYDCKSYVEICKKSLYAGLETFEILASSTYHNAVAAIIGACEAQEAGRMSLAWTLTSTAARHVQVLGYHRESTYQLQPFTEAERKRLLFWTIYSMDKNLSLVLGRSSYLQDYDIDVEYFIPNKDPLYYPWDMYTLIYTKLSQVQGQVYERLYSSSASRKTTEERQVVIEDLTTTVAQLHDEIRSISTSNTHAPDVLQLLARSTDVTFYSLQTLIYRAECSPKQGAAISARCFEAARSSLQAHLINFPFYLDRNNDYIGAYVNWVLLYSAFTPFIVMFLHALASHSTDDLHLLDDVTASLKAVRAVSKDCERLYQTCTTFVRVAKAIVGSHQHQLGTYTENNDSLAFQDTMNQTQVGGLGHLPEVFTQDGAGDLDMDEMSMFFGNWLGSNQPVMDLLNVDLANDMF